MSKWMFAAVAMILAASWAIAQEAPKAADPNTPSAAKAGAAVATAKAPVRLVHWMGNFANDKTLDEAIELTKRAAKAGYTGMAVIDTKIMKWSLQDKKYAENLKKFRQACTDAKMDLYVGVASFGYAGEMLALDANLAEGMPVRNAPFVVKDGKLVPADDLKLLNGGLETFTGDEAKSWTGSTPGKVTFVDDKVKSEGKVSIRIQDPGDDKGHGRIAQQVKVRPFQYYHLSAMVKTEGFTGKDLRFGALDTAKGRWANWNPPPIKPDMDWTRIDTVFNSLDSEQMSLYIGTWGGKKGKMWIDDLKIEPAGFVNIIRRDSLPLKVTSEDGKTVYAEGKDFSKIEDPKLLKDHAPGYFTVWHNGPEVTIPAGSKLKDGDKVLVSYHHIATGSKPHQINICMTEPKTYKLLEDEIKFVKDNLKPEGYFMQHDEIRHAAWDDTCTATGKTAGGILADNATKCTAIIEKVDPGKVVVVWNDMFDPHHNAKKDEGGKPFIMYMVRGEGPWYGSWEGLPKQVGIINWSGGKADSFKFFADRGHQQIVSGNNPAKIAEWLKGVGQEPGVVGIMFTNWERDYKQLEAYVEAVKKWESEAGYKK